MVMWFARVRSGCVQRHVFSMLQFSCSFTLLVDVLVLLRPDYAFMHSMLEPELEAPSLAVYSLYWNRAIGSPFISAFWTVVPWWQYPSEGTFFRGCSRHHIMIAIGSHIGCADVASVAEGVHYWMGFRIRSHIGPAISSCMAMGEHIHDVTRSMLVCIPKRAAVLLPAAHPHEDARDIASLIGGDAPSPPHAVWMASQALMS